MHLQVLSEHKSILRFLARHNPDPSGPHGVRADAFETFIRSSAGCARAPMRSRASSLARARLSSKRSRANAPAATRVSGQNLPSS